MYNFFLDLVFSVIAKLALLTIDFTYYLYTLKDKLISKPSENKVRFNDYKFNYNTEG